MAKSDLTAYAGSVKGSSPREASPASEGSGESSDHLSEISTLGGEDKESYLAVLDHMRATASRSPGPKAEVRSLTAAEEDKLLHKDGELSKVLDRLGEDPKEWKSSSNLPNGVKFLFMGNKVIMLAKGDAYGVETLPTKKLSEDLEDKLIDKLHGELVPEINKFKEKKEEKEGTSSQ